MLSLQSKIEVNFHRMLTIPKWICIISLTTYFFHSFYFFALLHCFDISVGFYGKYRASDDTMIQQRKSLENIVTTRKYGKAKENITFWQWVWDVSHLNLSRMCTKEEEKWNIKIYHAVWSERLNKNTHTTWPKICNNDISFIPSYKRRSHALL